MSNDVVSGKICCRIHFAELKKPSLQLVVGIAKQYCFKSTTVVPNRMLVILMTLNVRHRYDIPKCKNIRQFQSISIWQFGYAVSVAYFGSCREHDAEYELAIKVSAAFVLTLPEADYEVATSKSSCFSPFKVPQNNAQMRMPTNNPVYESAVLAREQRRWVWSYQLRSTSFLTHSMILAAVKTRIAPCLDILST